MSGDIYDNGDPCPEPFYCKAHNYSTSVSATECAMCAAEETEKNIEKLREIADKARIIGLLGERALTRPSRQARTA